MAKKKSKTQKSKKNQKKKIQTTQKELETKTTEQKKTAPKKKVQQQNKKTKVNQTNKPKQQQNKTKKNVEQKSKQVVDKKEVKYNVVLKDETKPEKEKQLVDKEKVEYNVVLTKPQPPQIQKTAALTKVEETTSKKEPNKFIIGLKNKVKSLITKIKSLRKEKDPNKKYVKKDKSKKKVEQKPKNVFIRVFYVLKNNFHILFNVALIVTYIILLIGLIRSNAFTKGTIIYASCLLIFLMLVAIGYNKYISGKVFSLFIIGGMIFAIYNIQYTYDFINNLNSNQYEYKTYYVVTFNNGQNKSIYNINNKKVCLLKDNSTNIERTLNTKLDSVNYVVHEDPNAFYQDFYNTNCRAIVVNKNQYKYLTNNIENSTRSIKILYEFKANGKK